MAYERLYSIPSSSPSHSLAPVTPTPRSSLGWKNGITSTAERPSDGAVGEMEANCGGSGKSHRRGFLTTRSLREAWPEGAYDGTKQPQRERQRRALRQKARRGDSGIVAERL